MWFEGGACGTSVVGSVRGPGLFPSFPRPRDARVYLCYLLGIPLLLERVMNTYIIAMLRLNGERIQNVTLCN